MDRILHFFRKYNFVVLFLFLEILGFILLNTYNIYQQSVFYTLFTTISGSFYTKVDQTQKYFGLKKINDSLVSENTRLQAIINSYQLQQKIDIQKSYDTNSKFRYIYKSAHVVNNSFDKNKNFITLNIGRNQGIEPRMAVVTDKGIVGIVKSVSDNFSIVISVLNSDFRLNARILETNDLGSVVWDGKNPFNVILKDIPNQTLIKMGHHVVVGPYSQYFPENIPIGTVTGFDIDKGGGFYNIYIHLNENMRNVKNVYVIKNLYAEEQINLEMSNSPN